MFLLADLLRFAHNISMNERGKESPLDIHTRFRESVYGRTLEGKPRWDMYRPSHVSAEAWIGLLGPDADNLHHMELTYRITDLIIRRDENSIGETDKNTLDITPEEGVLLRLAAIMHDWGESYDPETGIGGDINYGLKTPIDTQNERAVFDRVFDEVIGDEDVKLRYIVAGIIFDKKDNKLGQIFDGIEKVGYLRTAMIAFQKSKALADAETVSHMRWLTADVLARQMIPLMKYAADFRPIRSYLKAISPLIDEAFREIDPKIFAEHGQPQNDMRERYNQAQTVWERGPINSREDLHKDEHNIFSDNPNFKARFHPNYETLLPKIEACRALGLKIVLTSGSYDLMHVGHQRYISKASEYGDVLVVGVDSDEKIRSKKGPDRPLIGERERAEMITHSRGVGFVTVKRQSPEKWELIKLVRPDVLIATAETYTSAEVEELEALYCKRVVVLAPQGEMSTTSRFAALMKTMKEQK